MLASAALAQEPGPTDLASESNAELALEERGSIVQEVIVEGTRRIEPDAIKAVIGTKVGEPLDRGRIAQDVRRIYGLGFFHDVRIEVTRAANGGAIVSYVVVENPVIRQVSITGNEELGSDDIKEKLTITVGSTVDYPLLLENAARIEAQYQAKGYYLAKVKYVLEPMGEGSVGVNFDVVEGKKLRLTEIDFRGNEALSDGRLEKVMQTKTWGFTSYVSQLWDNSGLYAEPIFYQDLDKIQRLYMDEGYVRVSIGQPEVSVSEEGIVVAVDIAEGPQFVVGTVDILGDETMDRAQLFGLVELHPGEVFSRSTLSADVDRLRGYYADRGFFDASVNPITNVDPDKKEIATSFEVKKGELYFVEGIDVNGNVRTADTVVRRQLSINEGELYSAQAVANSKMRVQRLGYFEEVEVRARPTDVPNRVAMTVDLVERPTGSFSFGAGVGSVDGFIVSGSITQENLFGTGRSLSAGADMGSQNHYYYVRFVEPYVLGSAATLSLTLNSSKSEYNDFDQEQSGFAVSVGYPLDEGETFVSTGYSFASRKVSGFEEFQAASLLEREEYQGDTTTSLVNLSLRRDTRDDIRFPKSGHITRHQRRLRRTRRLLPVPATGRPHDALRPAREVDAVRVDLRLQLARRLRAALERHLRLRPARLRRRPHVRVRSASRAGPEQPDSRAREHRSRSRASTDRAILPRRSRRVPGPGLRAALARPAADDPRADPGDRRPRRRVLPVRVLGDRSGFLPFRSERVQ